MINNFKLHLPLDSYIAGDGKPRTIGDIYIQLDDYFFPETGWFDFGENLLSWWTEEFTKLLTGELTEAKCGFMDGAFRFDIKVIKGDLWLIKCIREYASNEECLHQASIRALQASESLLEAISSMIDFLQTKERKEASAWLSQRKKSLISAMQQVESDNVS